MGETEGDGSIEIIGAFQNNLKGVDVQLPLNAISVITGLSGSGKSSLAFDTLYAEGQRRYVESLSAYARQFLDRIQKPAVREIHGISPAIAIRQKNTSRNPRSTVGTVTEIYDFLRLLFSRAGKIRCRRCGKDVRKDTVDQIVEQLLSLPPGTRLYVTFPLAGSALELSSDKESQAPVSDLIENLVKQGFHRLLKSPIGEGEVLQLPHYRPEKTGELLSTHVLVDRIIVEPDIQERLTDSLEMSFHEGNGIAEATILREEQPGQTFRFSERMECQDCGISYRVPEPSLFSFNSPYGACPECHGFGNTISIDRDLVIPDSSKSLVEGAIDPFTKPRFAKTQIKLLKFAEAMGIPTHQPYRELTPQAREMIWEGSDEFVGVRGFFKYLERKKYKMYVRIFMSRYRGYTRCSACHGERLRPEARDVYFSNKRITQVTQMTIKEADRFFRSLRLSESQLEVAGKLLNEISKRLDFLNRVGLDYLSLDRLTSTLSGGEMQRIHLAASLGSSLSGALYVLDEPSIGLHPRDQDRLVGILERLRDLGNTIVVVEHEKQIILSAQHIVDMGPGAGEQGGEVVFSGDAKALAKSEHSLTAKYLRGELQIPTPVYRRNIGKGSLVIHGASQHNLANLDLEIPLGVLVCVTGVSGSGKSTLVHDVIYSNLKQLKGEWKGPVGRVSRIEGWEQVSDVLLVDQSPIGKTPRSNPVTYIKAFDEIRSLFAAQRESRSQGLAPAHFSFNIPGGRCETCRGSGTITVEMQFLADVELECEECRGTRYQRKILDITYKGRNIHEVLKMTVREALTFFSERSSLVRKLQVLDRVGLGYLRLGQSATTLSGGEAQRIKLASYLSKKTSGSPLFIFDEPTTGLHFDDIRKLLKAFDTLIAKGASVLVIEHNLDVIKSADWIIDLGPEGGLGGGRIVAEGTPALIVKSPGSYTGKFLKPLVQNPAS